MEFLYQFQIYLPLKDKNRQPTDVNKLFALSEQIITNFGGLTSTSIFGNPVYEGYWKSPQMKKIVKDENSIFTVLTPKNKESINFFLNQKQKWQTELNYEELLIVVNEVQTI